jgi:outer membrane protein assembly factor BamB
MKRSLTFLLLCCAPLFAQRNAPMPQHHDAAHRLAGTIIVPASDFFAAIPAGDSNDGRFPAGEWFFNNNTINMSVADDVTAKVPVREAGVYHLFVRSIGTATSSFHVKIDGKQDTGTYGHGKLAWQQGGDFTLKPGAVEIRLTSIVPRPSLNVLVLTKNAGFKEDDLKALELPEEVKLLHEYTIEPPNIVKFGDIDGSGKFAILDITGDYSTIMYANDGHELWRWTAPPVQPGSPRGNEAAGILWDFHHTGRDELAHWRLIDGKEWLVLCDGRTGEIIRKVPWPAQPFPHVANNYRMAVAKFHKESDGPDTLLVFSDTGGLISLTAYDKDLNQLWQHSEPREKDYFGHYIWPIDVNGDGVDEVFISHLSLDANGKEIWNNAKYFQKNNDHMDSMEFFDINGDGKLELLTCQSDVGTLAYNAQTGAILWQNISDHSQQITAGYILANSATPQVVTNGRTYIAMPRPAGFVPGQPFRRAAPPTSEIVAGGGLGAQLYWFNNKGKLLETWPAHMLFGNPNFVRGDWYGNGKRTYFWFRFKLEPDGNATLFFKGEVYHMFDFDHIGAEQVITLDGGTLRVYGNAGVVPHPVKRDAEYRRIIANHTHY